MPLKVSIIQIVFITLVISIIVKRLQLVKYSQYFFIFINHCIVYWCLSKTVGVVKGAIPRGAQSTLFKIAVFKSVPVFPGLRYTYPFLSYYQLFCVFLPWSTDILMFPSHLNVFQYIFKKNHLIYRTWHSSSKLQTVFVFIKTLS